MILLQIGNKPFRRAGDGDDLLRRGIQRTWVHTEGEALEHLVDNSFDIVFLDLDIPAISGPHIVSAIRHARFNVPIFAFTTNVDTRLKVRVLDLGADDVMTELCPIDELLARMRAVMRRLDGHGTSTMLFGPLEVLMDTREVRANGAVVRLTPTEYLFLEFLVRKHGAPVTKKACLTYLYSGRDEPDVKMIDVMVCRIRKKLATAGVGDLIKNVWGHGYKLEAGPPSSSYDGPPRRRTDAPNSRAKIGRERHPDPVIPVQLCDG